MTKSKQIEEAVDTKDRVLSFPKAESTSKESQVMAEAARLARLAPGEWKLWIDRSAERLGVPRSMLEDLVVDIIKDNEKKARQADAETRRQEARVEKQQERIDKEAKHKYKEKRKALKAIISLPHEQHEGRLTELAKRLDEDPAALHDDFSALCDLDSVTSMEWHVEPWPEPVEAAALLQEIVVKISQAHRGPHLSGNCHCVVGGDGVAA